MSILQLIVAGGLDRLLAAVLWIMVERRCPFLVVAGPSRVGKSTMMEALLAFLPGQEVIVPMRGMYESFAFLKNSDPEKTCLLCAEIGWGMPHYLWGRNAVRFFECLKLNYNLAATLHAESARETIEILRDYLEVPADALSRLGFVVSLGVAWDWRQRSIDRWVSAVDVIAMADSGHLTEVAVYRRLTPDGPAPNMLDDVNAVEALAGKAGMSASDFVAEVHRREAYIADLIEQGVTDYRAVREKIAAFRSTALDS